MTVSIKRLSAGTGYRYLMKTVAAGDGSRDQSTALTRYYNEAGTPPGRWMGSGLAGLADGHGLQPGSQATEQQMFQLFGMGNDPITGDQLSARPYREGTATQPGSVAGFDLTFSAQKSVSALWALSNFETQTEIVKAHHEAVAVCLALLEAEVAATRIGTRGVAQVDALGLIAVAFDHWDSRAGDPQLHTHLVIANRVQAEDGKWRTLDGKALYASIVAISETYNALLADQLAQRLGLDWQQRTRPRSRHAAWEIAAVPDKLVQDFSQRAQSIEVAKDDLVNSFRRKHGREPTDNEVLRLRQQATLATRPEKVLRPLSELTHDWRERASRTLGEDAEVWAKEVVQSCEPAPQRSAIDDEQVNLLGCSVVDVVSARRSTWTPWNLHAEASRQLMGVRFGSTADRLRTTNSVVDAAVRESVLLAAPALAATPPSLLRADGTSMFQRRHAERYTASTVLDAEARLLRAASETAAPRVAEVCSPEATETASGVRLGTEQAAAIDAIASSGRTLDLLVGPAGTGKTATLAGLRSAWESEFGPGSVVGLAPSAASADVLSAELGISAENTAKWLAEADREPDRLLEIDRARAMAGNRDSLESAARIEAIASAINRWRLHPGQLVIIDEASLAGTQTLARITDQARNAGAKVLLVGDWAQLSSIDAGGAFAMLARRRDDVPELETVRRFAAPWEGPASRQLRLGDPVAIDAYRLHDRVRSGLEESMLDHAYSAWRADEELGKRSLLLAGDGETVIELNRRARADLTEAGVVEPGGTTLACGNQAGAGDRIVTRKNNRMLRHGQAFVKNGDEWLVTRRHKGGDLTATRVDGGQTVRLPSDYVAEHVDLAYATTAYRAQGRTVETAHAVVSSSMTREVLYVAMTRAREANSVYVVTEAAEQDCDTPDAPFVATPTDVLAQVLARVGTDVAAHDVIAQEQELAASVAQLADEYETIATLAESDRWADLIARIGLHEAQVEEVLDSESWGALTSSLRHAAALGLPLETTLPMLVAARSLADAEDVASVLHERVTRWTAAAADADSMAAGLIAGLIPRAAGVADEDMQAALDEREALISQRVAALLRDAIDDEAAWLRDLGEPPRDESRRTAWWRAAMTVAAYRDRFPTGSPAASVHDEQRERAEAAARLARRIASTAATSGPTAQSSTTPEQLIHTALDR
jgi:conjugative relaxase-like TrwC/TraI family protein